MFEALSSRKFLVIRLVILLLALVLAVWASPAEETLGNSVKIVYVHGSIVQVGELLIILSGVLGLIYFLGKSESVIRWSAAFQKVGLLFLLVSLFVSLYAASQIWGNINFGEPRLQALIRILVAGTASIAMIMLFPKPAVIAWSGIVMVAFSVFNVVTAVLVVHPDNAIGSSNSFAIKFYYGLMLVLFFVLAMEIARLIRPAK